MLSPCKAELTLQQGQCLKQTGMVLESLNLCVVAYAERLGDGVLLRPLADDAVGDEEGIVFVSEEELDDILVRPLKIITLF